jgi:cell wall-associated NlpC family hydrolase
MHKLSPASVLVAALVVAGTTVACGGSATRPAAFPSLDRSSRTPAGVPTANVETVVQSALSLRGTRYKLGGQHPRTGLDCSGLVLWVFSQNHVSLPRTVDEQFGAGQVIDFDRIQAGDLLFFATTKDGLQVGAATHVGIAVGPPSLGEFVHAPGSGSSVRVDRFDSPYWRARWVGARRVLVAAPAIVSR